MSDLIDRQAAIKAIENLQDCYNGFSDTYDKACIIGVIEEIPTAQPNTPTDTPTDLISRRAAIEEAKTLFESSNYGYMMGVGYNHAVADCIAILNNLPSAQPERCEDCRNFNKARLLIPQPDYDLSGYSDRLWKSAYERGKAEAQLEKDGLVKKNGPIIIKTDRILTQKERLRLQKEFEEAGSSIILLPAGFDLAETSAKWIDKKDPDYSGGGYSQCENCGARFSWGAYHEPQEFRHCPMCGHRMEVEEDE